MERQQKLNLLRTLKIFCFIQLFFFCTVFSQNSTKDFYLKFPDRVITNSLYNSIIFLDSRIDTSSLGIIYEGVGDRKLQVIPRIDLSTQFNGLLKTTTDSSARKGELVFQLRKFRFSETKSKKKEYGYCSLRAELFIKTDSIYTKLQMIDTFIVVEGKEATAILFNKTSEAIGNFVLRNLKQSSTNSSQYLYKHLLNIDFYEKRDLKLYNTEQYLNGVYYSFWSFKNQLPDCKIINTVSKRGDVVKINAQSNGGEKIQLTPGEIYAYVYEGKPYISAEFGCYQIEKKNDAFYFIGVSRIPLDAAHQSFAQNNVVLAGGLIGYALYMHFASKNATAYFLMSIDHLNGGFNRIKQIKN